MKVQGHVRSDSALGDRYITKGRLDLNDLIKRRQLENKIDRKTNLIIFSGATTIAAVVLIILIL
tara:strand:+ start:61 stop:252 length:192 start_codon:yes stop_codon:yes gene_type:complete